MRVVIFANGDFSLNDQLERVIQKAERIIAVDGGANHCAAVGISPDVLIGDCDSIDKRLLEQYLEKSVPIHKYPEKKDATDLELALEYAEAQGATSLDILAALGGRWDMSLSNILLSAQDRFSAMDITLLDAKCRMQILHPGIHNFSVDKEQRISLLPINGNVDGVSLQGMMYPLNNASVGFGSSLGISNVAIENRIRIEHRKGILLSIFQNDEHMGKYTFQNFAAY